MQPPAPNAAPSVCPSHAWRGLSSSVLGGQPCCLLFFWPPHSLPGRRPPAPFGLDDLLRADSDTDDTGSTLSPLAAGGPVRCWAGVFIKTHHVKSRIFFWKITSAHMSEKPWLGHLGGGVAPGNYAEEGHKCHAANGRNPAGKKSNRKRGSRMLHGTPHGQSNAAPWLPLKETMRRSQIRLPEASTTLDLFADLFPVHCLLAVVSASPGPVRRLMTRMPHG